MFSLIKATVKRVHVVKDLLRFLWKERLWWMAPMVIIFIIVGCIMIFAQSTPLAPFIYTLF